MNRHLRQALLMVPEFDADADGSAEHEAPNLENRGWPCGRRRQLLIAAAVCVLVPLVLYVLLTPDWFYIQNGLDPFFYTAYVQNFNNAVRAAEARHYFISRWTVYMPQRVVLAVVGSPKAALLLTRWIGAGAIVGSILLFGRRHWRHADAVALAVLVLLMPISIRALFDDYADTVVLTLGIAMIVLLACRPNSARIAVCCGAFAGAMAVANPFALSVSLCVLPFWLARLPRPRWRVLVPLAAGGGLAVVGFGFVLFRVRYGIPNVYAPTWDFIREKSGGYQDPLKSPRLWWLGYRLWIYIPLLLLLAYVFMRRVGGFVFSSAERMVMHICALQYGFQIWYQFSRHGDTLEISYYWAYMLPALLLAFCVIVGRLAQRARPGVLSAAATLTLIALAIVGSPTPKLFSSWLDALILAGCSSTSRGVLRSDSRGSRRSGWWA